MKLSADVGNTVKPVVVLLITGPEKFYILIYFSTSIYAIFLNTNKNQFITVN